MLLLGLLLGQQRFEKIRVVRRSRRRRRQQRVNDVVQILRRRTIVIIIISVVVVDECSRKEFREWRRHLRICATYVYKFLRMYVCGIV